MNRQSPTTNRALFYAWVAVAFALSVIASIHQFQAYMELKKAGWPATTGALLHYARPLVMKPWFAVPFLVLMISGLRWLIAKGKAELEPHIWRGYLIALIVSILCFLNVVFVVR